MTINHQHTTKQYVMRGFCAAPEAPSPAAGVLLATTNKIPGKAPDE